MRRFAVFILLLAGVLSMDAVFQSFLAEGMTPKQIIRVEFRKAGDIYFPVDESFNRGGFYKVLSYNVVSGFRDISELLYYDDDVVWDGWYQQIVVYFGYPVRFNGVGFAFDTFNTEAHVAGTPLAQYWDGTNWTAVSNRIDGTLSGGLTLAQSGIVRWDQLGSEWQECDVNGTTMFWIRLGYAFVVRASSCQVDFTYPVIKESRNVIYNECIKTVGNQSQAFNVEPENYGPTIGSLNFSFYPRDEIKQMVYFENWKSAWVHLIEYFGDNYRIGGDNVEREAFTGVITEHPRMTDEGVSVTAESMQAFWDRKKIPSQIMTAADWPRIPSSNEGRPYPIIIGNDTSEKEIICVDEGASVTVASEVAADALSIPLLPGEVNKLGLAATRPPWIMTFGKEKILCDSLDLGNDLIIVEERGFADTIAEIIPEAAILSEYRPHETWLIGQHTMTASQIGNTAQIYTVNPDDDRERWLVPSDWYTVTENETTKNSNGITYIQTKRPIRGYFASTLNQEKTLKTCQNGAYPSNQIEVKPSTIIRFTSYPTFDYVYGYDVETFYQIYLADMPVDTQVLLNEGWINPENLFGNTSAMAQFQGLPEWNPSKTNPVGKSYAILRIKQASSWGMTGNIIDGVIGLNFRYGLISAIGNQAPIGFFFYRGNYDQGENLPNTIGVDATGGSWDIHYSRILPFFLPLYGWVSIYENDGYEALTWEGLKNNIIDIYVIQNGTSNLDNAVWEHDWSTAASSIDSLRLIVNIPQGQDELWLWNDGTKTLPNIFDGSDVTGHSANGYLPPYFTLNGMAGSDASPLYNQIHSSFTPGSNGFISKPEGASTIVSAVIRIKYSTTLDGFNQETFWLNFGQTGGSGTTVFLEDHSDQTEYYWDVTQYFNADLWEYSYIRQQVGLHYHDVTPVTLNNIELTLEYLPGTGDVAESLWTDDEEFWAGYLCGSLQSDGVRSYAWLRYRSFSGSFTTNDGVLVCPVYQKDLDFGLVDRVYMQITCQINPHNEDTHVGGCMHHVGDEYTPAAWAWYSHFNYRANHQYTGTTGQVTIGETLFEDASATFDTWGVKAGDVVYYDYDSDNSPVNNQGSFVVKWLGNGLVEADQGDVETQLIIDEYETRKWDLNKTTWESWAESSTTVKYRIFRPYLLNQTGEYALQEIDITDQMTEWDADLDFGGNIYVRGHLLTDPGETGDQPYYDRDENASLFRLWMPKLRLVYNYGKQAIVVVKGMDGINSGDDNPVSAFKWLAQNETGIDSSYFDDDSFTSVEVDNEDDDSAAIRKVDYHLRTQESFKTFRHDMTFPFGWHVLFGETMTAKNGQTRRVLDGTVLTQAQDIRAYGAQTQWVEHDYSEPSHAAADPVLNTEADSAWGAGTNCSSESVADPRTGSSGSYSVKVSMTDTEGYIELRLTGSPPQITEDYRILFWLKASHSMTIRADMIGQSLIDGGISVVSGDSWTVGTNWMRRSLFIPKDVTKRMNKVLFTVTGAANKRWFEVDDLLLQRQVETVETPVRQILVSNPIQVMSMGSVGKMGPFFTDLKLSYDYKPWRTTKTLSVSGTDAVKILTSQGSQRYATLQSDYGNIPLANALSELRMISDENTARAYMADLNRYLSERYHIEGMNLGKFARQLEVGDIIFAGLLWNFPQQFMGEPEVLKYFQVLTVDSSGNVSLIEVNDNFTDCLI